MSTNAQYADLEAIAATIARSPILVARASVNPAARRWSLGLPAGFDEVDLAILSWIAAEGRRTSRGYLPI